VPSAARYRRRLAREQDAASVYRALAKQRAGEEREILLALARAEERHAAHWEAKLHPAERAPRRAGLRARTLGWLTRRLGSLVVLALVQRAEAAGDYDRDPEATPTMAADEQAHALVAVVGVALFATGATVGVLTGGPLLRRGLRQLGIGAAAALVTFGLGRAFGTTIG
jgi:hypothetical protein